MENASKINSGSCPVCQNLCSTQAVACPKCGHPISQINQNVEVEKNNLKQNSPRPAIGRGSHNLLWIFFAFSLLYALVAVRIWSDMPYALSGYANSTYHEAQFAIAYHVAPLIIMIIILAIVYSGKERP